MIVNVFKCRKTNREKGVYEKDYIGTLEAPPEIEIAYKERMTDGDPFYIEGQLSKYRYEWENANKGMVKNDEFDNCLFLMWLIKEKGWKHVNLYNAEI